MLGIGVPEDVGEEEVEIADRRDREERDVDGVVEQQRRPRDEAPEIAEPARMSPLSEATGTASDANQAALLSFR